MCEISGEFFIFQQHRTCKTISLLEWETQLLFHQSCGSRSKLGRL